jgi:hypothetical protein
MIIHKYFLLLLLALISVPTLAYNPEPDAISIKLGAGDTSDYTAVRYACDMGPTSPFTGNDTTGDGSLSNPYQSWVKARTGMGSVPAGTAVALCRGGTFTAPSAYSLVNPNSRAENPLVFRDYMPLTSNNRAAPKIALTSAAEHFLKIEDSGTADADEGYAIINLEIIGVNAGTQNAIKGYNDSDHVTIDNCYIHNLSMPFGIDNTSGNGVTERYAITQMDDLVFASVPGGPDTITRTVGTWGANIKRGDGIVVTLSNSNNKTYRVKERVSPTVLSISEGKTWEVTDESNTEGVMVQVLATDKLNSNWEIKNSLFTNLGAGIYSSLNEGSFHDNIIDSSGFIRAGLDHSLYLATSANFHVYNNVMMNNSFHTGICKAAVFVMHGKMSGGLIEDNVIYNRSDTVDDTCYGIAFDTGYTELEYFTDFIVRRNTLMNVGSVGIGCNACVNVEISDNYIASARNNSGGASNGIAVPDRAFNGAYGNPKSSNILITGNVIKGFGASALSNASSSGIKVSSTTETEGTFTVSNNVVDGFYSCIKTSGSSGATLTVTGNTTTNCGAGGGEQP